jgi:twitching motility two-component system response regulator PilH
MHLKLRQKRQIRHFRNVARRLVNDCKALIHIDLTLKDTDRVERQKLAADVHLCSVNNYGESSPVHKKVLIVDDSPSEVKLMQGLLEKEGYWPVGLNDPRRVEEMITSERPNVILLDVVMPDRNGFQVCRDLKGSAEFNGIPVIMVTSKDSASDKFWGQQQGADGYVTKPFTREELLRAVRRFA